MTLDKQITVDGFTYIVCCSDQKELESLVAECCQEGYTLTDVTDYTLTTVDYLDWVPA